MKKIKCNFSYELLYQKYWIEKLTIKKIAKICGCNYSAMRNRFIELKIRRRSKSEMQLGRKFSKKTRKKIGLANTGRNAGSKHYDWKGGQTIFRKRAFILQKDHPYAKNGKYVPRSRLVAEKALGRYLKPNEIVHHIDENVSNDENNNLLICTRFYHNWLHQKMRVLKKEKGIKEW